MITRLHLTITSAGEKKTIFSFIDGSIEGEV